MYNIDKVKELKLFIHDSKDCRSAIGLYKSECRELDCRECRRMYKNKHAEAVSSGKYYFVCSCSIVKKKLKTENLKCEDCEDVLLEYLKPDFKYEFNRLKRND